VTDNGPVCHRAKPGRFSADRGPAADSTTNREKHEGYRDAAAARLGLVHTRRKEVVAELANREMPQDGIDESCDRKMQTSRGVSLLSECVRRGYRLIEIESW
jgi:hypothetical protein